MVSRDEALPGRAEALEVEDRHVVLGAPLKGPWPEGHEVMYFAMGCFWGAERIFWRISGVYSTAAGYMGGYTPNPTYEEVCTGRTGHAEAVQVVFDPQEVSAEILLKEFWENHDPTQVDRQGNDRGTQYRSAIYTTTPEQLDVALESMQRYGRALRDAGFGAIATEIVPADKAGDGTFYYAESYHQGYLHKNPGGYCNHGFCQVAYEDRPSEAHSGS